MRLSPTAAAEHNSFELEAGNAVERQCSSVGVYRRVRIGLTLRVNSHCKTILDVGSGSAETTGGGRTEGHLKAALILQRREARYEFEGHVKLLAE